MQHWRNATEEEEALCDFTLLSRGKQSPAVALTVESLCGPNKPEHMNLNLSRFLFFFWMRLICASHESILRSEAYAMYVSCEIMLYCHYSCENVLVVVRM